MPYVVRDATGATQTFNAKSVGGAILPTHNPVDSNGNSLFDPALALRSTAFEASRVFAIVPGSLFSLDAYANTAGFILLYDAVVAPADGAVQPMWWCAFAGSMPPARWNRGLEFNNGLVAVFSTTGPFVQTKEADAAFVAQVA
jgi:hypothetical protein